MAEHWKYQRSSRLPSGYYHYNRGNYPYNQQPWQAEYSYHKTEKSARYKIIWQSAAAIIVFILIIAVCRSETPQMTAAASQLRGWFTADGDMTPIVAWFEDMGLRQDSFDRAGYEVIRANAMVGRIDEEILVPVSGRVISTFGWQNANNNDTFHQGITIAVDAKEDVKAAYAGTVLSVERSESGLYTITIAHANGLVTTYGALSRIFVKADQMVDKGDIIAQCSDNNSQLYFEVKHLGEPIDPLSLLKSQAV